jgi:mono/diheme cytochrome c family protein
MTDRFTLRTGALVFAMGIATLLVGPTAAQDPIAGQEEFRLHCAACHGMTGLGDGPIGPILKTPAPNLAFISERNGGKFPFQKVYEIIDGKSVVAAHGTRDMPIWGERYRTESKPVTPDQANIADQLAQQRILSLVYFIGTLQ